MGVTLQTYISQVRYLIHDTNSANFANADLTTFINLARNALTADVDCARSFVTGLNTIGSQETYNLNGSVGGVSITSGGSNYTSPSLTISGGSGTGATALATVTSGVITSVSMTSWGSSYTSTPTISVSDSTGSGASLAPITLINGIDAMSIAVIWGNERITLDYVEFTLFQATLRRFQQSLYDVPRVWTLHPITMNAYFYPIPAQVYPLEIDFVRSPIALVNLTDVDADVPTTFSDAVQYYAAYLAYLSLQNQEMASKYMNGQTGMYDMKIRQLSAKLRVPKLHSPTKAGVMRMVKLQRY